MSIQTKTSKKIAFQKELAKTDLDDIHTIRKETARTVLTDARMELIDVISTGDVESVRDLARRVERNVSIVSRDLSVLYEADIIEYEEEGRSKRPILAHSNILVSPVVFAGRVLQEED